MKMRTLSLLLACTALFSVCGWGPPPPAVTPPAQSTPTTTLTITWAKWPPSEAFESLAKEWGRANNVDVKCEFFPWEDYTDKVFSEFAKKGAAYDIVVGDSQWIGKCATEGHYLELTDW